MDTSSTGDVKEVSPPNWSRKIGHIHTTEILHFVDTVFDAIPQKSAMPPHDDDNEIA